MKNDALIDWIYKEMMKQKIGPTALAKFSGLSVSTVARALNKQTLIKYDTAVALIDGLGYEIMIKEHE